MPLSFPLLIVAGLASAPAEPGLVVPLPIGTPGADGQQVSVELSARLLLRFGTRSRTGDTEFHWHSAEPVGTWKTRSVAQDDDTRTTILTRVGPGSGPATMTRFERFFGNTLTVRRETIDGPGGPAVRVKVQYFPIEGVVLAVGFDTLALDVFAGLELIL